MKLTQEKKDRLVRAGTAVLFAIFFGCLIYVLIDHFFFNQ